LLDRFLMATFGDSMSGTIFKASSVPPETLDELVRLTFQTQVRPKWSGDLRARFFE